jgi:para-nitrobenzyl esterase
MPGRRRSTLYNVAWHAPVDGGIYRAPHTIDIPLAFGNTAASAALTGTGPEQAEVSRNVLSSFVVFARAGNPNNDRVPEWPAYETATGPTMSFDVQCQIVPDLRSGDRVAIGTLQTRSNSGPSTPTGSYRSHRSLHRPRWPELHGTTRRCEA